MTAPFDAEVAAHSARLYCEADYAIPALASGGGAVVPLDTVLWDTDGFADLANHRLAIPAGWPPAIYTAGFFVVFQQNVKGSRRAAIRTSFDPSGTDNPVGDHRSADPSGNTAIGTSGEVLLEGGDNFALYAQQLSGVPLFVLGTQWGATLWLTWRGWLP